MEWTNERVDELRRLWGQGQTASRIAELLGGVTRNAVIGKAHRLGLRGRPSPIRREEGHGHPASRPVRAAVPAAILAEELTREPPPPAIEAPVPPPMPAAATGAAAGASKMARNSSKGCSWPVGDPKLPGFHFCGAEAVPGRPYCAQHCTQAYQRKPEAA